MLRIYLDQNKWIDLARAAHGSSLGDPFRDVLEVARAAVAAGHASFPLDMARYLETHKRADYRSRRELATTMHELSRLHGLAPTKIVLPSEIDQALCRRIGVPSQPRTFQPFGIGIAHTSGRDVPTESLIKLPAGLVAPPGYLAAANHELQRLLEWAFLVGPNPQEVPPGYSEARDQMTQDAQYARYETDVAAHLAEQGYTEGERLERALWATDLGDILQPLEEALRRVNISVHDLLREWSEEQWLSLLKDIPTRDVTTVLRRDKHAQGQQKWEPNDLLDVQCLPVAAVYCDVVVTERQWVSRMSRAKVDQRYNTRLLHDIRDLVPLLIDSAAR